MPAADSRLIVALDHPDVDEAQRLVERLGDRVGFYKIGLTLLSGDGVALSRSLRAARETGSLMPPAHIRNAPTKLMKQLGYGAGYAYDHDAPEGFSGQNYFPEGMERRRFYEPKGEGREAAVRERLERWAALRERRGEGS